MAKYIPFISKEVKAARTKGIPFTGKITLNQYEALVKLGYDGERVMKWTKYKASQELSKKLGSPTPQEYKGGKQQ